LCSRGVSSTVFSFSRKIGTFANFIKLRCSRQSQPSRPCFDFFFMWFLHLISCFFLNYPHYFSPNKLRRKEYGRYSQQVKKQEQVNKLDLVTFKCFPNVCTSKRCKNEGLNSTCKESKENKRNRDYKWY
jgi:hypothetical protein